MDIICCWIGFYLYLQIAVLFSSWKLIHWDHPKWADLHKDDTPTTLRNFCMTWLLITPCAMFLDAVILATAGQMLVTGEWIRIFNALPFLLILLASTYAKTQFIHMCWLTLQAERLKKRDKKN